MPNIGIVLSGCASKGGYEAGSLCAIEDFFGMDSIRCVSSASIGALIGHVFGRGRKEEMKQAMQDMYSGKYGRWILNFTNNKQALADMQSLLAGENSLPFEHYVSIWNTSASSVEYLPFHTLSEEELQLYMRGAVSFPIFTRGVVINGQRYMDGALVDNIPVYPLIEKELDYIICIYFDNCRYVFESEEFDRKIIKLHDFPNQERLEVLFCDAGAFEKMYDYGYAYTTEMLEKLFADPDKVYEAIAHHNETCDPTYKRRLTADVVLSSINAMTKRYAKSLSNREKVK